MQETEQADLDDKEVCEMLEEIDAWSAEPPQYTAICYCGCGTPKKPRALRVLQDRQNSRRARLGHREYDLLLYSRIYPYGYFTLEFDKPGPAQVLANVCKLGLDPASEVGAWFAQFIQMHLIANASEHEVTLEGFEDGTPDYGALAKSVRDAIDIGPDLSTVSEEECLFAKCNQPIPQL